MALKLIAVQGMTVIVDAATVTPPGTVVATIVAGPPGSTKVKAEAKLAYLDGDSITVTAITVPGAGATTPDPGPYNVAMSSSATKVKAEGTLVLLEGDQSATINAVPKIPGSPPIDYPVSFKCKVSVAGQAKAKAQ
jgi:hypothetical protein